LAVSYKTNTVVRLVKALISERHLRIEFDHRHCFNTLHKWAFKLPTPEISMPVTAMLSVWLFQRSL